LHTAHHLIDWFKNSSNVIALASAVVAGASGLYAGSSAKSARKTYRLTLAQDARRDPNLIVYLSDARILTSHKGTKAEVSITITNPTDIDNSVTRAELQVTYRRSGGPATKINITSSSTVSILPSTEQAVLDVPVGVPSHQAIAGQLTFLLPAMILHDCAIDNYSLSLHDTHQKETKILNLFIGSSVGSSEDENQNG
jgi:hypothetical protein